MRHKLERLFVAFSMALAASANAAEPATPRYNTVELQAEAQREVPNDLLTAVLYVELNDASPAALAQSINSRANEALRVAKEHKSVRARSGNSQTYPVYGKGNVLQGWRGRAEIRIESRDVEAASALIGKLQSGMQLAGLSFAVSPETRRAVENELIGEAIAAFRARAEIARAALSGTGYKVQRISLSGEQHLPPQPRFSAARAAAQEVAAPQFEAGISRITLTASGSIEIIGN